MPREYTFTSASCEAPPNAICRIGAFTYVPASPTAMPLEKFFSSDARYCGEVAFPKSQVVWESPSLTLFAENAPMPTDSQFAGGPCAGCWRRICASALPDITKTAEGSVVNVEAFYFGQHRYFFSLWAAVLVLAIVVSTVVRGHLQVLGGDGFRLGAVAAAIVLAWSPNRRLHATVTLASLAALLVYIVQFSLRLA